MSPTTGKNEREPNEVTSTSTDDELVIVTLTRADYNVLRDIVNRQKSLNWVGRYVKNVLFVAAGGIITLLVFGEQVKKLLSSLLGS